MPGYEAEVSLVGSSSVVIPNADDEADAYNKAARSLRERFDLPDWVDVSIENIEETTEVLGQ